MAQHLIAEVVSQSGVEVHKFGGSSLASSERFKSVATLVLQQSDIPWVVVSAPGDTTDILLQLISCFHNGDDISQAIAELSAQLHHLIEGCLTVEMAALVQSRVAQWLEQIPYWLALKQHNDVLAIGELLSATLLAAVLTEQGRQAKAIDSREFLVFNHAEPDWQLSAKRLNDVTTASRQQGVIHVVTGYIGRNQHGESITLGRNGSDYSATLLAALLKAKSVSVWTDVTAIYSADPRKCVSAIPYSKVNKRQAYQLAQLGNPVLHARTLAPLAGTDTSLLVRSALQPQHAGCEIIANSPDKAFLTSLNQVRLVSLARNPMLTAEALAQQIQQPVIVLPQQNNINDESGQCWLMPTTAWSEALALLNNNGEHPLADTCDYYALVWLKLSKHQQVSPMLSAVLYQFQVEHLYENDQLAIWLFKQELTVAQLNQIHQHCIVSKPELQVLVAGTGNVGAEFLNMLPQQQRALAEDIKVELAGVFNSRKAWLGKNLNPVEWHHEVGTAASYNAADLLAHIRQLPAPKVLVDITPSLEFAGRYRDFIAAGCHIISANKQGVTLPFEQYDAIRTELTANRLSWRSNTTVGAGIPVQQVMQALVQSGDKITRISGVFSGTLSWLLCKFDGSISFSALLTQAAEQGFTEPDPRDDLSGIDVQRKLLVLARELGLRLDLEQISLQPLMPEALKAGSWQQAWQQRQLLDDMLANALKQAQSNGKVLRYAASLTITSSGPEAEVSLLQVSPDEPLAALAPCDNIFVIESEWYNDNPLVLKGPGAGKQVTAGGIHADVAQLCQQLILSGTSH